MNVCGLHGTFLFRPVLTSEPKVVFCKNFFSSSFSCAYSNGCLIDRAVVLPSLWQFFLHHCHGENETGYFFLTCALAFPILVGVLFRSG